MYSGDEEGPLLYRLLARSYPQHNFYLIGRSDLNEELTRMCTPANIIDMFNDATPDIWSNAAIKRDSTAHFWLEEKIKRLGLKFDVGIFFLGPSSSVSIPGVGVKNLDGTDSKSR